VGEKQLMRHPQRELRIAKTRGVTAVRMTYERRDLGLVDRDPVANSVAQPRAHDVCKLREPVDSPGRSPAAAFL